MYIAIPTLSQSNSLLCTHIANTQQQLKEWSGILQSLGRDEYRVNEDEGERIRACSVSYASWARTLQPTGPVHACGAMIIAFPRVSKNLGRNSNLNFSIGGYLGAEKMCLLRGRRDSMARHSIMSHIAWVSYSSGTPRFALLDDSEPLIIRSLLIPCKREPTVTEQISSWSRSDDENCISYLALGSSVCTQGARISGGRNPWDPTIVFCRSWSILCRVINSASVTSRHVAIDRCSSQIGNNRHACQGELFIIVVQY